jgi:hypothetical protein
LGYDLSNYQLTLASIGVWQPVGVAGIPRICSHQATEVNALKLSDANAGAQATKPAKDYPHYIENICFIITGFGCCVGCVEGLEFAT